MKDYTAVIEKCPDTGLYVGYVSGFVEGETIDELVANLQEVVAMLLEDGEPQLEGGYHGIRRGLLTSCQTS
jgi:predicted RNase H-like HicB family nuclease